MGSLRQFAGIITGILISATALAQETEVRKSGEIIEKQGRSFYKHQVREGQSIQAISRAYEIPPRVMAYFNKELVLAAGIGTRSIYVPVYYPSKTFITHKIRRKQTLYYISRKYDIPMEELFEHNQWAKENASRGDELKIPVKMENEQEQSPADSMYVYVVKSGEESLYYIAKKFGVRIEALIDANEGTPWYPEQGDSLRIPLAPEEISQEEEKEKETGLCEDFTYSGEAFRVALLFPLDTEANYQNDTTNRSSFVKLTGNTDKFFEYYQGVLLALDTMRRKGISFDLYVYDTESSRARVREIMQKPEMEEVDLIFGPAYSRPFAEAAKMAKKLEIPIVAPLSRKEDFLVNNPYVIKIKPDQVSSISKLAEHLSSYWEQNFVVLHDDSFLERERLKIWRDELVEAFTGNRKINDVVYKEVNLRDQEMEAIEKALSNRMNNVVIIPSTHEPFVTDLIGKLHFLFEKYNIWVIGMAEWADFRGVNMEYFHELQVHYSSFLHLDYNEPQVAHISRHFKQIYGYAPTLVTLEAFEVSYMIFKQMTKYGEDCFRCLEQSAFDYPNSARFKFTPHNQKGGMKNTGSFIIRYTPDFYKKIQKPKRVRDYFRHRPDTMLKTDEAIKSLEQEKRDRGE